ncbi:MAG: Xylose isomerase protein barrel, partial [Clostridiales bacterium]|jgi:sugar phosphate isomerase/epimerase|nr:Xylose isomerase protein barrel [Clostridiales bacterium]
LDAVSSLAKANGITIETGLRGIQPENLCRYIAISKSLNATLLRCVIDSQGFEPNLEEINSILLEVLPSLIENNIILGIENHDRFTTDIFSKIVQDINHPNIGIVLDTVNSVATLESVSTVLKNLAKYTVNLHIKDYRINRRKDASGLVVVGTPAGDGVLNIPSILDVLKKDAPSDFNTILELWMDPEETLEETLQKEETWVRKSVAYLKSIISDK